TYAVVPAPGCACSRVLCFAGARFVPGEACRLGHLRDSLDATDRRKTSIIFVTSANAYRLIGARDASLSASIPRHAPRALGCQADDVGAIGIAASLADNSKVLRRGCVRWSILSGNLRTRLRIRSALMRRSGLFFRFLQGRTAKSRSGTRRWGTGEPPSGRNGGNRKDSQQHRLQL